ncbi:MAG TPA: methyltransferase domain-containing protein [Xanthomonadaceae bacterium]|nr:methyltransferase domain-containing protein [Xanthomonadaceae bacterium]
MFDHPRIRSFGRALARQMLAVAPASKQGQVRQWLERVAVAANGGQRDPMPPIHQFWYQRYMKPAFNRMGFDSAADLVRQRVAERARAADPGELAVLCVGVGEAHEERELAIELRNMGVGNVVFHCIGSDADAIKLGEAEVARQALSKRFRFEHVDMGRWRPRQRYPLVVVHHALHRQARLEWVLDAVAEALTPDGEFLVEEVIGRNGHRLWPEARKAFEPLWAELPDDLRLDRITGQVLKDYPDIDATSDQSNGLRAAEVLPELERRFHFRLFAPYANLVMAILGRRFGPNFNEDDDVHRNHLQQVHMRDRKGLLQGEFAPTRMVAVLTMANGGQCDMMDKQLTPASVVAWIRERRFL